MAITDNQSVESMLKVFYAKEGVQNLLFRNSPLLKKIQKTRVEGKVQNFCAMYGRGGASGADYTKAIDLAKTVSKNVEFSVEPGQLYSVYTVNVKEVQASKSNKGAYAKIAGSRMFAASESLRKTLAAALYGMGYGEICAATTDALTSGTAVDVTLPADAIMKIDVGSELVIKSAITSGTVKATLTVNEINGTSVNVTSDTTVTPVATDVICLAGSMDASGNPALPVGLGAWLPVVGKRTGTAWQTYIGTEFFGVKRNVAADRLAGAFVAGASGDKKIDTIQKLLLKVRRQGSEADLIVMNDEDWLDVSKEIESSNTYFTQTSTKAKKNAVVGMEGIGASFSTNFIENIIDDSYCVKGRFYILDSKAVEFFSYTNTDKINDGISENNPGKQDPMAMENEGHENDPSQLIIDDYINVQAAENTFSGPAYLVSLMLYGSFAVTNPSVCGVGEFGDSADFAA